MQGTAHIAGPKLSIGLDLDLKSGRNLQGKRSCQAKACVTAFSLKEVLHVTQ